MCENIDSLHLHEHGKMPSVYTAYCVTKAIAFAAMHCSLFLAQHIEVDVWLFLLT